MHGLNAISNQYNFIKYKQYKLQIIICYNYNYIHTYYEKILIFIWDNIFYNLCLFTMRHFPRPQLSDCQACTSGMYCTPDGLETPAGPCPGGYYCPLGLQSSSVYTLFNNSMGIYIYIY